MEAASSSRAHTNPDKIMGRAVEHSEMTDCKREHMRQSDSSSVNWGNTTLPTATVFESWTCTPMLLSLSRQQKESSSS